MRISYLKTFVDLAETLNFRQTSENRNLTQPAVTQIIKSLENELQLKLFNRTKHHVSLTNSGVVFYEDMKLLLKKFDSSVERVKEFALRENTTFTIGFTGTVFESRIVPDIISNFNKDFPDIQIHLVNFNHNILKEELLSKSCDVIFQTFDSIETLSEIQFTQLMKGEFVCVVPNEHPLSAYEKISFSDLIEENIILFNSTQCPPLQMEIQRLLKKKCYSATFCYADSILLSHTMVQAGLGISVMPNFVTNITDHKYY